MNHLPEDIIKCIQQCLTKDDNHYFLNSNKQHFGIVKMNTIYFALTAEKSLEYVKNKTFRQYLLGKVANGWKQIGLIFSKFIPEFSPDIPIHSFNCGNLQYPASLFRSSIEKIEGQSDLSCIPFNESLKELTLHYCPELRTVKELSHLSKLSLYSIDKVESLTGIENVPDLTLSSCSCVPDFSMLDGIRQKRLKLDFIDRLVDVSLFRNVRVLIIEECIEVEDVSALRSVFDLSITRCPRVRDISVLGNHHRLKIDQCAFDLMGYEILLNIPIVELLHCDIVDVGILQSAKSVRLFECPKVKDVSALITVRNVEIHYCSAIENIDVLREVPKLSFNPAIIGNNNESALLLKNHRLTISHSEQTQIQWSLDPQVQHFTISFDFQFCNRINNGDTSFLQHLQSLRIRSNPHLKSVNGLGNIPVVKLLYCNGLCDISGLGKNRQVELTGCNALTDVSSLATVPVVTIRRCPQVKDFNCLNVVPRLKIVI